MSTCFTSEDVWWPALEWVAPMVQVAPVLQWLRTVLLLRRGPGSFLGHGDIYMGNSISAVHPAHSAVMSRPDESEAVRVVGLKSAPGLESDSSPCFWDSDSDLDLDSNFSDLDPKDSDFAHETKAKAIHELLVNDLSQEKFVFHPEHNSLLTDLLHVWQS